MVTNGFPFWVLDAAVYVAAIIAWGVVLYISYRTVGYVQEEFIRRSSTPQKETPHDQVKE